MKQVYIAFYKHKRQIKSMKDLIYRIADDLTKFFTRGIYSHCEIVVKRNDGKYDCYSSSNRDSGVRHKLMELPLERWDLIEIKNFDYNRLKKFYKKTKGLKYDFFGALGVVLRFGNNKNRYFCSEWCAETLKLKQPHKYSPNSLYEYLKEIGVIIV